MRIAFLKYRLQLPGFELPETLRLRQQEYDDNSARILEDLADWIEGSAVPAANRVEASHELVNRTVDAIQGELPTEPAQSFTTLLHGIDGLTTSLASGIASRLW
jgi:hypothetical protein